MSVFLVFPRGKMSSEKIPRTVCMREDLDVSSQLAGEGTARSMRK